MKKIKKIEEIEELKITKTVYYPYEQDIEIPMSDKISTYDEHHSYIDEENLVEVLEKMQDKLNQIIKTVNLLSKAKK